MAIRLSAAVADYDRIQPLLDGSATSDSVDLQAKTLAPSEIFYRLLNAQEFDVAEMSLSSYFISRQHGDWDYVAIPVFPNRRLFHLGLWTTADGPDASELTGTSVGLTEYQVTAAVWTRGVLADDFGLDLRSVKWRVERTRELSHGGETGFEPPEGTEVTHLAAGDTLEAALDRGDLDVILPSPYAGMASRLNRTDEGNLETSTRFRPLFTDPRAEARRYLNARPYLPMNHTVVIRKSVLAENPGLAREVFRMFDEAKQIAQSRLAALRRSHLVLSNVYLSEERALFGADPYPYGYTANADALETLARYLHEQGLIEARPDVPSLFEPSLLDT